MFDLLFTFQSPRKRHKQFFITYLTNKHTRILLTLLSFALPILHKLQIYYLWFLFGATPGVDSYSRHLRTINT